MGGVEYASEYGSIQLRQVSHHSYQHHKNISPYGAFSPLQDIIFSADNRSVSMRCARACGRARGEFPCAHVQRGHRASVLARAVADDGAASRTSSFFLHFVRRSIHQVWLSARPPATQYGCRKKHEAGDICEAHAGCGEASR